MKIIIYLLLIIIILLLIYDSFYNVKEPLKKWKKALKKAKKSAVKNVTKPPVKAVAASINKTVVAPVNRAVVAPVSAPIVKHVVKPAIEVVKNPVKAINNLKQVIQKQYVQPIKIKIDPPPPPPQPTRAYEYDFHSGIPKEYKTEILTKLSDKFNGPRPVEDRFITEDNTHKCMFKYSPKIKDLKFVRTIINPEYNFDYTISTTKCGEDVPPEKCNKNEDFNMRSVFIEEKPNQYLDYELDKNKVFLHYKDETSETVKTYKDYNNVVYEDINPIYRSKYNVCEPKHDKFNIENGFDDNFPCGVLVCNQLSEEEKENSEKEINYDSLNATAKEFYDNIIKYEHESAIDKVLSSVGFTSWINLLNQNQSKNTEILNTPDINENNIVLT